MEVFYHLFPESKIAVGNANHIYLAQRYRYKKERKVKADYDEFWESLGGIQREDGLWELAKTIARKPIEEIPSKKRSQYRSRYQDRKSTRLNSSHANISYAVFCLKKKKIIVSTCLLISLY